MVQSEGVADRKNLLADLQIVRAADDDWSQFLLRDLDLQHCQFVVRIDADRREVIVGPREALLTRALSLKETNWIGDAASIEAACAAASWPR